MQITSRFTIAVHVIACVGYFQDTRSVTSAFLAGSVGVNPVMIRNLLPLLRDAGILSVSQGKSGVRLTRDLSDVTFYDVYRAVDCVDDRGLFHFHAQPNPACPVGKTIHAATDGRLSDVQRAMENEMKTITLAGVVADVVRLNRQ